jgi:hypothetical protein
VQQQDVCSARQTRVHLCTSRNRRIQRRLRMAGGTNALDLGMNRQPHILHSLQRMHSA